jgi:hypothetical protein
MWPHRTGQDSKQGKEPAMNTLKHLDTPALILGIVLLGTGLFYMLRNTFGLQLGEINWDGVWPFVVIAFGGSILFKTVTQQQER